MQIPETHLTEAREQEIAIKTSNLEARALGEAREMSVMPSATGSNGIPLRTKR
ncbi:hypothetical protein PCANC_22568 [Puccinia coronata f. sp. avenae]|uniref:Uncharacterized protein n=1 Tax=Puccinia coronata f. sp. avenae TaxID=200324 RepID=A0A2N5UN36_9BASI|nr:hypothetical protein PCANC_22568 [Puccinia coronata f. sp. avenae]